jgi:hypothetical protein
VAEGDAGHHAPGANSEAALQQRQFEMFMLMREVERLRTYEEGYERHEYIEFAIVSYSRSRPNR